MLTPQAVLSKIYIDGLGCFFALLIIILKEMKL